MIAILAAIGNLLIGLGSATGGIATNVTTLGGSDAGMTGLAAGLNTVIGPLLNEATGIASVISALGTYLVAPGTGLVAAILGIL